MDELQGLISELKTDEREKANYMTYQMKITEERNDAKNEERVATALDMLRDNEPLDKIVKYSHLSRERIEELALQLANGIIPTPSL